MGEGFPPLPALSPDLISGPAALAEFPALPDDLDSTFPSLPVTSDRGAVPNKLEFPPLPIDLNFPSLPIDSPNDLQFPPLPNDLEFPSLPNDLTAVPDFPPLPSNMAEFPPLPTESEFPPLPLLLVDSGDSTFPPLPTYLGIDSSLTGEYPTLPTNLKTKTLARSAPPTDQPPSKMRRIGSTTPVGKKHRRLGDEWVVHPKYFQVQTFFSQPIVQYLTLL